MFFNFAALAVALVQFAATCVATEALFATAIVTNANNQSALECWQLDANVSRISDLHGRSLNNTDETVSKQSEAALDELVAETRSLSSQIKSRIGDLEKRPLPPGQNVELRRNQVRPASRMLAWKLNKSQL